MLPSAVLPILRVSLFCETAVSLRDLITAYDPDRPLARAETIPSGWYTDPAFEALERRVVLGGTWQLVARLDQLARPGAYVTVDVAGEPLVIVRGTDDVIRGFFNVCRHHAAAVMTEPEGCAQRLRCPYHGWTYDLDGGLRAAPEFKEVEDFAAADNGLLPVRTETWEQFVFVNLDPAAPGLLSHLGGMAAHVAARGVGGLRFFARREYELACNWKVFVDNYLDGGYHVPHIHEGLGSVLDYRQYRIENFETYCLQSSPMDTSGGEDETAAVRGGDMAFYYWLYPNLMLNWYEGYLDTNLVVPLGIDRCRVVFDFYFAPDSDADHNARSVAIANRVQEEDIGVCESVQRGLHSRAYETGRLSVRREAGEHLFHRLLHRQMLAGIQ